MKKPSASGFRAAPQEKKPIPLYLNSGTQKKLMPLFHYALNPEGLLFLGSSESVSGFSRLCSPIQTKWRIFRRKESSFDYPGSVVQFPARPGGSIMLTTHGYTVLTANSGKKAHKIYRNHTNIDLVILDMIMPGMGGSELYDRLKEIGRKVAEILNQCP